jgi:hypothetical protein
MRKSFAGRLHEAMSAASRRASSRTEALFLSVREMVDRIGFEPLTSAVHGTALPHLRWWPTNGASRARDPEGSRPGPSRSRDSG